MCDEVAYLSDPSGNDEIRKSHIPADLSTFRELGMSLRPGRLLRRASLGSSAVGHIRLQRVRRLDRVLRGRADARSDTKTRKYPFQSTIRARVSWI